MRLCSHGEKANLTRSCCKLHFPTLLESCKRERMALSEINLFGNPDYDIVFTALAHEDQENMENVDHLCRGRTEQRKMPAEKSKSLKGISTKNHSKHQEFAEGRTFFVTCFEINCSCCP